MQDTLRSEFEFQDKKDIHYKEDALKKIINIENYKLAATSSRDEYIENLIKILYCTKLFGKKEVKIQRMKDKNETKADSLSTPPYIIQIEGNKIKMTSDGIEKGFNGELDYEFIIELDKEKILNQTYESYITKKYYESSNIDKFNQLYETIKVCLNKIIEQSKLEKTTTKTK